MKRQTLSSVPRRWRFAAVVVSTGALLAAGVASAAPSDSATATSFHTAVPTRVLDTRDGTGAPLAPLGAGATLDVLIPGLPDDATAVAVNLTVVNGTRSGFLTTFAKGDPRPWTSSVNWSSPSPVANTVVIAIHADHMVSLFNSAGTVDALMDLTGYYAPSPVGGAGTKGDPGAPGAAGATGPQGVEGAVGPGGPDGGIGPEGPMGPSGADGADGAPGVGGGVANYLYAFHTGATTIAAGSSVVFSHLEQNVGDIVTGPLPAAFSTFTITTPGLYKVSFSLTANESSQIDIRVNGLNPLVFGATAGQNEGTAILDLAQNDVITLRNTTSADLADGVALPNTWGGTAVIINAWIMIEQLNEPAPI